uniref:Trans-2-enoyl-CoA reductase n=1 Tax=Euglena gracilis TaxID=3039 RepID=TER_EUGGR|nr:RecName: Full=Trans-2-enoyl-CoA reductase; Short=TER1; Flags: Precursor [Euglena gracilis]AAW66853.1 trans-2-enoyl-CoA reductase [Euglena gracilis]
MSCPASPSAAVVSAGALCLCVATVLLATGSNPTALSTASTRSPTSLVRGVDRGLMRPTTAAALTTMREVPQMAEGFSGEATSAWAAAGPQWAAPLVAAASSALALWWWAARRSVRRPLAALAELPTAVTHLAPPMAMFTTTAKVIQPKIRGFICTTTHPIGCEKRVQEEIAYARAHPPTSPGPKRVLVIGCSTGYGLSTRITAAFGYQAATLGVFLAGPPTKGRPAAAGWYNTVAFEKAALEAGLYARSLNGDAFDSTTKARTVEAIKRDLGTVDLVVYSIAAPKRTDPATGVLHKACLKPIGATYTNRTVNTDKAEVTDVSIEPASPEEIADTVKVMGGEDWELWIQALSEAGVLAEGAKTVAYSYIGPEMTWPVYWSGTIGEAKKDVEKAAKRITQQYGCPAYPVVAKALVTQASSAIPVVPLYICLLYRVMKEKGTHEGCIEQMVRLLTTKLYPENGAPIVDEAGRVRVDDWEMAEDVQQAVKDLWSQVSTANLKDISDFAGYQTEFLRLFGFGIDGVDYDQPVDVEADLPSAAQQ